MKVLVLKTCQGLGAIPQAVDRNVLLLETGVRQLSFLVLASERRPETVMLVWLALHPLPKTVVGFACSSPCNLQTGF